MNNNITFLNENTISKKFAYELKKLKKGEKIPIVSDIMFHTMLNNESRKKYVAYLLSLTLNKPYDKILNSIKFSKNKLDKNNFYISNKTADFICKIDNEIINIEMNNNFSPDILERNISYATNLHSSNMKKGSKYNYHTTIQININNFCFTNISNTIQRFTLKSDDGTCVLTNKLIFLHIYLPNIRKKYYNNDVLTNLEKLLLAFNEDNTNKLKKLIKGNDIMEEYVKDAIDASIDLDTIGIYDRALHLDKLYHSDIAYVKKESYNEAKLETAKNLLKENIDIKIIESATGLSKDIINELKNE